MKKRLTQYVQYVKGLFKVEEHELLETPKNVNVCFILMYKTIQIGTLNIENGTWRFAYSEEFKRQENRKIKPLVNFPDVEKVYESTELFPFFMSRIPGSHQPQIQEIVKKEAIDERNPVEMLRRFGKESITNPFLLNVAMA
jgi:HipA-like protein